MKALSHQAAAQFHLTDGIAILRRTPGVLRALLMDLPEDWTHRNEGPETWSPFDVVGHLIDGEETDWMSRAHIILAQDRNRTFKPFDRFRHLRANKGRSLYELLVRFEELRIANIRELESLNLTADQLQLTGEHPAFGTVTLEQLLATWVAHDLNHIGQIVRVMAKRYDGAVGPWKKYLSVLHRPRGSA